ncbi:tetratricopeptide repeat protein [Wenzhouxiangella sp. XN79A]|uniref:tetratricopeptide repeat protein n=1 Tax=Wenzhouxiangella sp. XN79A TaxID=2724193 RepID=UPI00144AC8D5|nr:tetratricopeptide repeat protein [Wenzhouxiangella sp. XN79A]
MSPAFRLLIPVALAGLLLAGTAGAQDPAAEAMGEDVERLPLAALLIGDGNYQRARSVLAGVDLDDEELDRVRYHTLAGLVALNLNEHSLAVREFGDAIAAGQTEPVVWLYLAQAHFSQDQFVEALDALDRAGPETTRIPSVYLMRAQAYWQLERYEAAWAVLSEGRAIFPDRASEFARRQVFLLVDQGLYQEAAEQGRAFLDTERAGIDDAIAIGNALRQSGQYGEAARILETARVQAPDNATVAKVLAHTYLDQDMTLAAAEVMRQAAAFDPTLVSEAAELYRRAGWLMEALTLNAQVIDQAKKFKQRLAIFIELGRFDQAAGMRDDLVRTGLLDDPREGEDIRYALAYANFKVGDFAAAEDQLVTLERADLFRKATELRRVMAQCADEPWLCR